MVNFFDKNSSVYNTELDNINPYPNFNLCSNLNSNPNSNPKFKLEKMVVENDNLEDSSDSLDLFFSVRKKKTCMIDYYDSTINNIRHNRLNNKLLIKEKQIWNGFQKPKDIVDINELLNKVINVMLTNIPIKLIIYHPYYRGIIYDKCKKLGLKYKSGIDRSVLLHDDNTLVLHFSCDNCIPLASINWYSQLDSNGYYEQLGTKCKYCENRLLSQYYYEENNGMGNNIRGLFSKKKILFPDLCIVMVKIILQFFQKIIFQIKIQ